MRTIRARLTLGYAAIFMATLLGLGIALYFAMTQALEGEAITAVQSLAGQAEHLLAASVQEQGRNGEHGVAFDLGDPTLAEALAGGGLFLEVHDPAGVVVNRSPTLHGQALLGPQDSQANMPDVPWIRQIPGIGPTLIYMRVVRLDGRLVGTIVTGRPLTGIYVTLVRLRTLLIAGMAVAVAAALIGGWTVAGAALRPVDRLTRAARSIGAGDLHQRLHMSGPDDELHRLAAAFDEMLGRLEGAFERERQFSADVAHELRTSLTVLAGELAVALRKPRTPGEYQRSLLSLKEEVNRLTRTVLDLLLLARADAGAEPMRRSPVQLDQLLRRALHSFAAQAAGQGVVLGGEGPEGVILSVDSDRLLEAVSNLIDNALRHTGSGDTVTVKWQPQSDGVAIAVVDNGEGITAAHLPHVFKRFYRAESHRSRDGGGAGLGLAITKWIVEAHGGRITVESRPQDSTQFLIWLPTSSP